MRRILTRLNRHSPTNTLVGVRPADRSPQVCAHRDPSWDEIAAAEAALRAAGFEFTTVACPSGPHGRADRRRPLHLAA